MNTGSAVKLYSVSYPYAQFVLCCAIQPYDVTGLHAYNIAETYNTVPKFKRKRHRYVIKSLCKCISDSL